MPTAGAPPVPLCAWKEGASIYDLLAAWDGQSPMELPDEPTTEPGQLRFASGARDGILTHHASGGGTPEQVDVVDSLLFSLERLVRTGNDHARAALYELLRDDAAVAHADALVDRLRRQRRIQPAEIRPHARWLLREARHREPLKLAIILVGVSGDADDVADLELVARHDEFTLYAAVAVANLLDDPRDVWWTMARRVLGWGKIHVVERLAEEVADRPDIRAWLLRHGCENQVMPEYLAWRCATAGDLSGALAADEIDDELRDGACLIAQALLAGGPAEDIDSYDDGAVAMERLLGHLERRTDDLEQLRVVETLRAWVEEQELAETLETATGTETDADAENDAKKRRERREHRARIGWTPERCRSLAERARRLLGAPRWAAEVSEAARSHDTWRRWLAWQLAPAVGVDVWDAVRAAIEADPLDAAAWFEALRDAGEARLAELVALGEARLPLGQIASGPGTLHGLGPEFRAHACLDALLGGMHRGEVFSDQLVGAALRSPVVRNRHLAALVVERHVERAGDPQLREVLDRAAAEEPDDELRERLAALVAGPRAS